MGLDMYLYAKRYLWSFREEDVEVASAIAKSFPELDQFEHEQRGNIIREVSAEIGYWRKANAIHRWFVDNIQDGVDNCAEYYVDPVSLQELRDTVDKVLNDHSKAAELLPTTDGFFFGNTQYGDMYFDDLEYTKRVLDQIINMFSVKENAAAWSLYYRASW